MMQTHFMQVEEKKSENPKIDKTLSKKKKTEPQRKKSMKKKDQSDSKMKSSPLKQTLSTEGSSGLMAIGSGNNLRATPSAPLIAREKRSLSDETEEDPALKVKASKSQHINLLGQRFKIEDQMLGFGSFGRTFQGMDVQKNKPVAIKIMLKKSMESFVREARVLKSVNHPNAKGSGFPKMLMSSHSKEICVIVQELLGMNLEELRKNFGTLALSVVCSIGIQMINRLETLHYCTFVHRDIKPQNIMLGLQGTENQNKIYLIDFGLSVPFVDDNDVHLPQRENNYNTVVGTALFASINAHQGKNLSRRDDIESLVYTLIYLLTGKLPWKSINIKKKSERHEIIMYMKEEMATNPQFRDNLDVPSEIFEILVYAQSLKHEQEPDYAFIKSLFNKILKRSYKIKKMADIDILMNNFEDSKHQKAQVAHGKPQASLKPVGIIDVKSIACDFGFANIVAIPDDGLMSVASNEQLAFKSDCNSSDMNEIQSKLCPTNFRQMFNGGVHQGGCQIIQEDLSGEDDEYGSEEDVLKPKIVLEERKSYRMTEEIKVDPVREAFDEEDPIQDQQDSVSDDECDDSDDDDDVGDEDISDDDVKQISGYSRDAKVNNLQFIKGANHLR